MGAVEVVLTFRHLLALFVGCCCLPETTYIYTSQPEIILLGVPIICPVLKIPKLATKLPEGDSSKALCRWLSNAEE